MNIADINKLAGAQGVRVSGKAERVVYTFEYTFPYRQTHTHLSGITLIYPKKSSSKEQQSCLVRLKYAASYERRDKYDRWASFYMDSVPEAFGLIYVFLMYPDRIRYELVKGKEKRNLTEKEFASLGKQRDFLNQIPVTGRVRAARTACTEFSSARIVFTGSLIKSI